MAGGAVAYAPAGVTCDTGLIDGHAAIIKCDERAVTNNGDEPGR